MVVDERPPGHLASQRIVVVGAAGLTNLGDDAIQAALLAELRETLPRASFLAASGSPGGLEGLDRVVAIPFTDEAIEDALEAADLLVVGGGGIVYDHDARLSLSAFDRGDFFHLYPFYRAALRARAAAIPVCFYAIGVGPVVTPSGRDLTRRVLAVSSAITVRDSVSAFELRRLGHRNPVPEVTADPAVRLPRATGAWDERPAGCVVGFVARPWLRVLTGQPTPSGREYFDRYTKWLASIADYVVDEYDATPLFLASQTWNDDDRAVAERVTRRMRRRDRAVVCATTHHEELQRVLASLDVLVSTRLHPLILASLEGVPLVGIALHSKVRAFMARLELSEFVLSPWIADGLRAAMVVRRALHERDELAEIIAAGIDVQARLAARNPTVVAGLLAGRTASSSP